MSLRNLNVRPYNFTGYSFNSKVMQNRRLFTVIIYGDAMFSIIRLCRSIYSISACVQNNIICHQHARMLSVVRDSCQWMCRRHVVVQCCVKRLASCLDTDCFCRLRDFSDMSLILLKFCIINFVLGSSR